MGLAIAAVVKGYKCIFTTTDKQSKEKIDALKAFGAEVIVCPTNVDPEDPRSYYSVSSRLERETPNSWKANQYDNLSNSAAHYEQTGPEIWDQTDGRVTHFVSGVGTGGTICGVGKFLKERNPAIKVWGIDTYGSVFKKYKETGHPRQERDLSVHHRRHRRGLPAEERGLRRHRRLREGDRQGRSDHDAPHRARGRHLRRQLRRRGDGGPAAAARSVQREGRGRRRSSTTTARATSAKMFNDDWMREQGFLEKTGLVARDLVASRRSRRLVTLDCRDTVTRRSGDDRARLLADSSDRRRTRGRIGQRDAPLHGDRARPGREDPARSRRSCSPRFLSWTSRRASTRSRR